MRHRRGSKKLLIHPQTEAMGLIRLVSLLVFGLAAMGLVLADL